MVGSAENRASSAPIELGLGLSLAILVMDMREGKIYPTLVLEGGFIFGKHMNLQWVCGQSLSAFPYPQTTSSQGWIPREILAAL